MLRAVLSRPGLSQRELNVTAIAIEYVDPEDWIVGGRSQDRRYQAA